MKLYRFLGRSTHPLVVALGIGIVAFGLSATNSIALAQATVPTIDIWWPTDASTVTGTTPLKAIVPGSSLAEYTLAWNVDGGRDVLLSDSNNDYPHKEAMIDFSSWNWKGSGPYTITLTARTTSGDAIAHKSIRIYTPLISSSTQNEPTLLASKTISIWWPTDTAPVAGTTQLKAVLDNTEVSQYKLFWQVDAGIKNEMNTTLSEWPHKEATVDTALWNWNTNNQYALTFTATDTNDRPLATKTITVVSENKKSEQSGFATAVASKNPLVGTPFFTGTYSPAATQVDAWKFQRPADAKLMERLVGVQDARWFGNWNGDVESDVRAYVGAAERENRLPVIVAYNIPYRDCNGYSSGGADSAELYQRWIEAFARGIDSKKAVVIVEPDALSGLECLPSREQDARLSLLASAVNALKANPQTTVYVDAGNPNWISVTETAARLKKANIATADGFSLNVSNYYTSDENKIFGDALSAALAGKHYIIDTSRNGKGSNGQWCNPYGRAIGSMPTTATGDEFVDAYLWIKKPGESDGACNGGPSAGTWWGEYALDLVKNSL